MAIPTLTLVAATTSQLQFSFNNPNGAGANYTVELNRAEDFSSDDSIFLQVNNVAAGSANGFIFPGLPSGTTWYARLISAAGERSPVVIGATSVAALTTTYTGYSIAKALLVVPVGIVNPRAGGSNGTYGLSGFPAANLLRPDPASTFQMRNNDAGVSGTIFFETSGEPIDVVALLGHNQPDDVTWEIHHSKTAIFNGADDTILPYTTMRVSPSIGQRQSYHSFARLPSPTTDRFWAINIISSSRHLIARNLVLGRARETTNADKGAGYGVNDLGSATRTRFGVLDSVRGWRGKVVDFAMSWISETEFQAKWADLPGLVGTTKAVLAIPNSKRNIHLNDRIAFGNITQMRGENVQSFKYSQTIEINSIY